MARFTGFRRAPLQALLVWQAVSLAAVVAVLAAAPAAAAASHLPPALLVVAWLLGGGMLIRVLWSGHRVGTTLRAERRRHRALVDLLGTRDDGPDTGVRVLDHPTPTAYCLPGLRRRVVLSAGALATLQPSELQAVLAHERAHLRARHDLVLEFFTVVHRSVPAPVRCPAALREVALLAEVLADRAARRAAGTTALARALVSLARAVHPVTGLTEGGGAATRARMLLLVEPPAPWPMRAGMLVFAASVLGAPWVLLILAAT